jgi:hypothetical protein
LPFHLEKRLAVFETKGARELRVVAEDRMDVEGKVCAEEREVVPESALEHLPPAARDRLQSRPKQTVMHDEKIYPSLNRGIEGAGGSVHRSANPGHSAGVLDLQTVKSIRPVFDFSEAQKIAAIIHQLGYGGHRAQFYSTRDGLNSGL